MLDKKKMSFWEFENWNDHSPAQNPQWENRLRNLCNLQNVEVNQYLIHLLIEKMMKRKSTWEGRARAPCSSMNRECMQTEEKDMHQVLLTPPKRAPHIMAEWDVVIASLLPQCELCCNSQLCFNTSFRVGCGCSSFITITMMKFSHPNTTLKRVYLPYDSRLELFTRKLQRPEIKSTPHSQGKK